MMRVSLIAGLVSVGLSLPAPSVAASDVVEETSVGPVTSLPLPRFVSMKASRGRVRRGPGLAYRIDWVFVRKGLPLEIIGEYEHWRRVRTFDGTGGWMHYSLLSGARQAIITTDRTSLRIPPDDTASIAARAEQGVVAQIKRCLPDWCRIGTGDYAGWVRKRDIWGAYPDEIYE